MKKKVVLVIAVALIAVIGLVSLVSCASDLQMDEFDTLTVATEAMFAPYEYMVGGEYFGFDMDLIREIGKKLNKKVEITHMDFDSVISSVSSGKYVVGIAGLTISPDRKEVLNFSNPYYSNAYQVLVVSKDNNEFDGLKKEEIITKLEGRTIQVAKGQVGEAFAKGNDDFGYSGIKNAIVKVNKSVNMAMQSVKGKEVAFADNAVAKAFCEANANYKFIDVSLTQEYYGIATKKSNVTLISEINKALDALKADGTYDSLVQKLENGGYAAN